MSFYGEEIMLEIKELELSDRAEFELFEKRYKQECGEEQITFGLNPDNLPYEQFFEKIKNLSFPEKLPEGWVPAKFYLARKDGDVIGLLTVRYGDSDFVRNFAGHIGYCIAPWARRKGYASEALGLLLPVAHSLGLDHALLTCNPENSASRKVILKNGGVLERRNQDKEIYRIDL